MPNVFFFNVCSTSLGRRDVFVACSTTHRAQVSRLRRTGGGETYVCYWFSSVQFYNPATATFLSKLKSKICGEKNVNIGA